MVLPQTIRVLTQYRKEKEMFNNKKKEETEETVWSFRRDNPENFIKSLYFICNSISGCRKDEKAQMENFPVNLPITESNIKWVLSHLPENVEINKNTFSLVFNQIGSNTNTDILYPVFNMIIQIPSKMNCDIILERKTIQISTKIISENVQFGNTNKIFRKLICIVKTDNPKRMYTIANVLQKCGWILLDSNLPEKDGDK